ncbi:unnamed protein product [Brassica oleracea]
MNPSDSSSPAMDVSPLEFPSLRLYTNVEVNVLFTLWKIKVVNCLYSQKIDPLIRSVAFV